MVQGSTKKPSYIAAGAFLVALVTGCAGATESTPLVGSSDGAQTAVGVPGSPQPRVNGAGSAILDFAQGSWLSSCLTQAVRQPWRIRLSFMGLNILHEVSTYSDSSCKQMQATWSRQLTATSVHRFEGIGVDLNVRTERVRMTVFGSYAKVASFSVVCNISDWAENVARDVSGQDCGPGMMDTVGETDFAYVSPDPARTAILYEGIKLRRER